MNHKGILAGKMGHGLVWHFYFVLLYFILQIHEWFNILVISHPKCRDESLSLYSLSIFHLINDNPFEIVDNQEKETWPDIGVISVFADGLVSFGAGHRQGQQWPTLWPLHVLIRHLRANDDGFKMRGPTSAKPPELAIWRVSLCLLCVFSIAYLASNRMRRFTAPPGFMAHLSLWITVTAVTGPWSNKLWSRKIVAWKPKYVFNILCRL